MQSKDAVLHTRLNFPSAARKIETLKELLAVSDIVSLHCSLTAETMQLINADALQHIKPGILLSLFGVNFGVREHKSFGCFSSPLENGDSAKCHQYIVMSVWLSSLSMLFYLRISLCDLISHLYRN